MQSNLRTEVLRRADYISLCPQETFIVPLLKRHIESLLSIYAVPSIKLSRALDVGCGRQPFRNILETSGYTYISLDVTQTPENTVDHIGAIDETPSDALRDCGQFQFVLCTEVLEHVADWGTAFKNLSAFMAPGGKLLITCPYFYQLHEEPHDYWRPTLYAIKYYADKVGLRVLEQRAAGDAWDVLGTLLANCSPAPASPRLIHRIANKIVFKAKTYLFSLLRRGILQNAVSLRGPIYLSNIVVMERAEVFSEV